MDANILSGRSHPEVYTHPPLPITSECLRHSPTRVGWFSPCGQQRSALLEPHQHRKQEEARKLVPKPLSETIAFFTIGQQRSALFDARPAQGARRRQDMGCKILQKPLRSLQLHNSDLHSLKPGRLSETIGFFSIGQLRSALVGVRPTGGKEILVVGLPHRRASQAYPAFT